MTFTNFVTFPMALAVRWSERVRGRAGDASDADLRVPPEPVNAILSAALTAESGLLRLINLPIGSSIMAIAAKRH